MPRHDDFRAAVEDRDTAAMGTCFSEDATMHSPAVFEPLEGRQAVMTLLGAVMQVFEDFRYGSSFSDGADREILEFHTRVGDKQVHGIDLLTFDPDSGLVTDLTVMLRPMRGLEAAVAAIGQRLAAAARDAEGAGA